MRVAVVTGTGGIGFEIALALARGGMEVVLAGRNAEAGAAAVARIRAAVRDADAGAGEGADADAGADVRFEPLDLADTDSVRALAARLRGRYASLDLLMCIAGLMMPDRLSRTKEGCEMQFAVNYLGHFLLARELLPLLSAGMGPDGGGGRVVTVTSIANHPLRFDLADATAARGYDAGISYALSKLCCLMFARELDARSREGGWRVSACCAHPGLARTRLFSYGRGFTMTLLRGIFFALPFLRQSAAHAALPALYAATSPRAVGGALYGPLLCFFGPPRRALPPLRALSRAKCAALWALSESLLGGPSDGCC
ncbi:MAG: SDR family NAD(P)-dependent oxidoreductase [Clostridiales Family XIII bacterium]|jgi:NAD(P)-dependent dehydrogenase (short-subunit alcohol dehydrogenase family)|nr:SDR family NAD(P)-dependent oxidoreductase [Clostridiales Family XIII bacterium]